MARRAPSRPRLALGALATAALLAGCPASGTGDPTLHTVMVAGFCPAAGKVRQALAGFPPAGGVATPADWRELRRPAIAMLDAAEALPQAVADLPGYADKVAPARTAGRALVEAVDRRDANAALAAGTSLLQACGGCHAAGGSAPALPPARAATGATSTP